MPRRTAAPPTVLVVVTNHGMIDDTVASPLGGPAPVDPRGYPAREDIAEVCDALAALNATLPLAQVDLSDVDGVFFPGGHGPMFDLATDARTKRCVAAAWDSGKPVAAVCHGPAALLDVRLSDGTTLLRGRRVTGFTRGEDTQDALFAHMPFSLQERMSAEGAAFVERAPGTVHVETDGLLVTGQNPASAEATAHAFLSVLGRVSGRTVAV